MQFENILKIGDIENSQLSTELLNFLQNQVQHTYSDNILKEHIYNIGDILDGLDEGGYNTPEHVAGELQEIKELCDLSDCGYFRVVYP